MSDSGNGSTPHLWVPGSHASWAPPVRRRQTRSFDLVRMKRFEEFWDLLKDEGLVMVCVNCSRQFGYGHDAVKPIQKPESNEIALECGCTRRVFKLSD